MSEVYTEIKSINNKPLCDDTARRTSNEVRECFETSDNGKLFLPGYAHEVNDAVVSKGHDYAEYFEWDDGNPSNEDRTGKFVAITDGSRKIHVAGPNDSVLGITSGTASVIGNYSEEKDTNKAWAIVGMIGIIEVKYEGDCVCGGYAMVGENGIASPSTSEFGYRIVNINTNNNTAEVVLGNDSDTIMRIKNEIAGSVKTLVDGTGAGSTVQLNGGVTVSDAYRVVSGNKATGISSFATGGASLAAGDAAVAMGYGSEAYQQGAFAACSSIAGDKNKHIVWNEFYKQVRSSFTIDSNSSEPAHTQFKNYMTNYYNNTFKHYTSISYVDDNNETVEIDTSYLADTTFTIFLQSKYSFAASFGTSIASGRDSFSAGTSTEALGESSCAIGHYTRTTNKGAFAFGFGEWTNNNPEYIESTGKGSFAEGISTKAYADGTHAEGLRTIAQSAYQHVQGRFNEPDESGLYAHIVGGGTDTLRKNIHTLTWDGNAWYKGFVNTDSGFSINNKQIKINYAGKLLFDDKPIIINDGKINIGVGNEEPVSTSAAIGRGLKSTQYATQFAIGRYNDPSPLYETGNKYYGYGWLFAIGNGKDDSNRSNAFYVTDKGKGIFQTSVEAPVLNLKSENGNTHTVSVSNDGVILGNSKRYATEDYVASYVADNEPKLYVHKVMIEDSWTADSGQGAGENEYIIRYISASSTPITFETLLDINIDTTLSLEYINSGATYSVFYDITQLINTSNDGDYKYKIICGNVSDIIHSPNLYSYNIDNDTHSWVVSDIVTEL